MNIDVRWYAPDAQYVATTTEYPGLSWLADTAEEASEGLHILIDDVRRDILNEELHAAVAELVTAVEGLAQCPVHVDCPKHGLDWDCDETAGQWVLDVHDTSDDTATITDAADNLNQRLGE
jgi:hypothetical protein